MAPDTLFQISGLLAVVGWLCLAFSPAAPRAADVLAALLIPVLLSVAYTALILVNWSTGPGGFGSLSDVMALFTNPHIALAGWIHYLAFDLLTGAWITRTASREQIPHVLVLPCLALTFLFGPAGFFAFTALRASHAARARMTGAAA